MAERLNKRQAESARSLIQTQRIIQELHKYLDGGREMESGQIRAAEILLSKSLPSLQAQQVDMHADGELTVVIRTNGNNPSES